MKNNIRKILIMIIVGIMISTVAMATNSNQQETTIQLLENTGSIIKIKDIGILKKETIESKEKNEIVIQLTISNISKEQKILENIEINDFIPKEAINYFEISLEKPTKGQANQTKDAEEKQIIWKVEVLEQGETATMKYKIIAKKGNIKNDMKLDFNTKTEVSANIITGKKNLIKDGKICSNIGGFKNYYKNNEGKIEFFKYENKNDHIYIEHENKDIIGSEMTYGASKPIDVTKYNNLVIKYRAKLVKFYDNLKGYHANTMIGLQKELGNYEAFDVKIFKGNLDVVNEVLDTGIITETLDISKIEGKTYLVVDTMDCGGSSKVYLYDAYLTTGEEVKEENIQESSMSNYKVLIKVEDVINNDTQNTDNTIANNPIPKTGSLDFIMLIIGIGIIGVACAIRYKRMI